MPLTRRELLISGLGIALLSAMPASARANKNSRMLVAVHLFGGNDGLNTVVPRHNAAYRKARPSIGLADRDLIPMGSFGLHPALRPLADAPLAVVHGVGYAQSSHSHFRSTEIWHSAAHPNGGWLGRLMEQERCVGVHIGSPVTLAMSGARRPPLTVGLEQKTDLTVSSALDRLYRSEPAGSHLHETWDGLQDVLRIARGGHLKGFPKTDFGKALSAVVQLMPEARVYHVSLGGFDTHSNQADRHANMLSQLAEGLSAFLQAVERKGLSDRVSILVYSEFGRRVEENLSGGTDHGTAGPVFLLGPTVRRGHHGEMPSLTDLHQGDLRHTVDFRRVYASVLEEWLGTSSLQVLGSRVDPLRIFVS